MRVDILIPQGLHAVSQYIEKHKLSFSDQEFKQIQQTGKKLKGLYRLVALSKDPNALFSEIKKLSEEDIAFLSIPAKIYIWLRADHREQNMKRNLFEQAVHSAVHSFEKFSQKFDSPGFYKDPSGRNIQIAMYLSSATQTFERHLLSLIFSKIITKISQEVAQFLTDFPEKNDCDFHQEIEKILQNDDLAHPSSSKSFHERQQLIEAAFLYFERMKEGQRFHLEVQMEDQKRRVAQEKINIASLMAQIHDKHHEMQKQSEAYNLQLNQINAIHSEINVYYLVRQQAKSKGFDISNETLEYKELPSEIQIIRIPPLPEITDSKKMEEKLNDAPISTLLDYSAALERILKERHELQQRNNRRQELLTNYQKSFPITSDLIGQKHNNLYHEVKKIAEEQIERETPVIKTKLTETQNLRRTKLILGTISFQNLVTDELHYLISFIEKTKLPKSLTEELLALNEQLKNVGAIQNPDKFLKDLPKKMTGIKKVIPIYGHLIVASEMSGINLSLNRVHDKIQKAISTISTTFALEVETTIEETKKEKQTIIAGIFNKGRQTEEKRSAPANAPPITPCTP